jgi:hypothetical protein
MPTRRASLSAVLIAVMAIGLLAIPAAAVSPASKPVSHAAWTALLGEYVKQGRDGVNRVDYRGLKARGEARLKSYVAMLEGARPSAMSPRGRKAYWINLYNAKTLDIVLSRYPVGSIRDISLPGPDGKPTDGPWGAKQLRVEGIELSLDEIEKKILIPEFMDFRIHYALNCLSIGCPNLLPEAFVAARLESQLDAAARAFVNHPRGITIKPGRVEASSIYEWYADSLGGFDGVIAHLRLHARPELRRRLASVRTIDAYDYDWTLNDTARP